MQMGEPFTTCYEGLGTNGGLVETWSLLDTHEVRTMVQSSESKSLQVGIAHIA